MRGRFDSDLVSVSQWFNDRTPVRKTGDLRFKCQLRHKFFSQLDSENPGLKYERKY